MSFRIWVAPADNSVELAPQCFLYHMRWFYMYNDIVGTVDIILSLWMVIKRRAPLAKKKATTSATGETIDTRPKTEAPCPNPDCGNGLAYFDQKQMSSADEPMSTFYECTKFGKTWRED
ncbi:DNA-directed RNA polymerase III subunit RPC10-like protein [Drosera capensis]